MADIQTKINEIREELNNRTDDYDLRLNINSKYYHLDLEYTNPYDDEDYYEDFFNYESLVKLLDDVKYYLEYGE